MESSRFQVYMMNSQPNFTKRIIAILDDHGPVLRAMTGLIEAYGARVLAYQNGQDFLRDMPRADCLVVDYYMPNLNGLQLAVELRGRRYRAPVIILTGMRDEIPEESLAKAGIREVVDKWSGSDALLRAIERVVGASAD